MVQFSSLLLLLFGVPTLGLNFFRSGSMLPIFHNVQSANNRELNSIIQSRYACSLSIKQPGAIDSLAVLCASSTHCIMGVSGVEDTSQLSGLSRNGVNFIMHNFDSHFISSAKKYGLNIFSKVATVSQCDEAVDCGCDGLIINPGSDTKHCIHILSHYRRKHSNNHDIPLFISGDIAREQYEEYLNYDDTLNFMIDFDFARQSPEEIEQELNSLDSTLNTISLRLRIQRDLKNSCL